jgi:transposase
MDAPRFSPQVEVLSVTDSGRRRRWSQDEKIRIVEESLSRPRAVASTARRHQISRALLTRWRAQYREGLLGPAVATSFVPIAVTADVPVALGVGQAKASVRDVKIDITLANGRRVMVPASIDPLVLARLLPVLDSR